MNEEKVRENRIRRQLKRMGIILKKSRARDPHARGYEGYALIDEDFGIVIAGAKRWAYDMSLDDVEAHIRELEEVGKEAIVESEREHKGDIAFSRLIGAILNDTEKLGDKAAYHKWKSAWSDEQSELVRACYPSKQIYLRMLRVILGHS